MEYTTLGNTGLEVSRICLGCMSYGEPGRGNHAVDARRGEQPAVSSSRRSRPASTSSTPPTSTPLGSSEEIVGRALAEFAQRDEVVLATKVRSRMRHGPERRRPVAQGDHDTRSTPACAGSAPTTSTSTRSTAGTTQRRSRRRSRRCTTSSRPARPATSARRRCTPGSSARRCTSPTLHGWTRFVTMQNHYNLLYREEEREMLPLCVDQGIGVIPWSPLARGRLTRALGRSDEPLGARPTSSAARCTATTTRTVVDAVRAVAESARHSARAGGAGLAAVQARHHRADRRRDQDPAPRRCDRGGRRRCSPPTRSSCSRSRTSRTPSLGTSDQPRGRQRCRSAVDRWRAINPPEACARRVAGRGRCLSHRSRSASIASHQGRTRRPHHGVQPTAQSGRRRRSRRLTQRRRRAAIPAVPHRRAPSSSAVPRCAADPLT